LPTQPPPSPPGPRSDSALPPQAPPDRAPTHIPRGPTTSLFIPNLNLTSTLATTNAWSLPTSIAHLPSTSLTAPPPLRCPTPTRAFRSTITITTRSLLLSPTTTRSNSSQNPSFSTSLAS